MSELSFQLRQSLGLEEFGYDVNPENLEHQEETMVEIETGFNEMSEEVAVGETIHQDIETLESIQLSLESSLRDGGLDKHSLKFLNIGIENIAQRYSLPAELATTSLEDHGSYETVTEVSMERIGDMMNAFGLKVKEIAGNIYNGLLSLINSIDKFIDIQTDRFEEITGRVTNKNHREGTVKLSGGVLKFLSTESGSVNGSSYISELKQSFAVLNELSDSFVKGKLIEQLTDIYVKAISEGQRVNLANTAKVMKSSDRVFSEVASEKAHSDRNRELWDVEETKTILGGRKFTRVKLKDKVVKEIWDNLDQLDKRDKTINITKKQQGLFTVLKPLAWMVHGSVKKGSSSDAVGEIERGIGRFLPGTVKQDLSVDEIAYGSTQLYYEFDGKSAVDSAEALSPKEITTIISLFRDQLNKLRQVANMMKSSKTAVERIARVRANIGNNPNKYHDPKNKEASFYKDIDEKSKYTAATKLLRQIHSVISVYGGILKSTTDIIRHGTTYLRASIY